MKNNNTGFIADGALHGVYWNKSDWYVYFFKAGMLFYLGADTDPELSYIKAVKMAMNIRQQLRQGAL